MQGQRKRGKMEGIQRKKKNSGNEREIANQDIKGLDFTDVRK